MDRLYYIAQQADAVARRRYAQARSKPQIQGEDLAVLDALVTPLIRKGQPLTHIYAEHGEELPVSQRTLYHYIDEGVLSIGNLDLRRKVGYRPRKKKKVPTEGALNQKYRQNRTYEDFTAYMARHPGTMYVEMDTVKGCREQGKRMLTMLFVEQNLMLILLMRDGKAETVVEQFDWLTSVLGLETFRTLFPVILTDNGSEFKHTREMEYTVDGQRRTHVFYCDPQASWQKPHIEKNHEYIRYVLPRGKSFNPYTQQDIVLLLNHINSTRRSKLDGKTPFELAKSPEFQRLKAALGLKAIPADEVITSQVDELVRTMLREIRNYYRAGEQAMEYDTFRLLRKTWDKYYAPMETIDFEWSDIQEALHAAVASVEVRTINGGNASKYLNYAE